MLLVHHSTAHHKAFETAAMHCGRGKRGSSKEEALTGVGCKRCSGFAYAAPAVLIMAPFKSITGPSCCNWTYGTCSMKLAADRKALGQHPGTTVLPLCVYVATKAGVWAKP